MARIKAKVAVERDAEGKVVDGKKSLTPSSGGGLTFSPLNAGFYTAIVKSVELGTYRATAGEHKNPNSKDGKWDYVKLRPTLHIPHDGNTHVISRHDLTVGVIVDDEIVRADGDKTENPVFGGYAGARFFLKELGFFHETDTGFELLLDTDLITNMVVRVRLSYEVYCKEDRNLNMGVDKFKEWLTEHGLADNAPTSEVYDVLNAENESMGYGEDEGLRLKSVPVGFYAMQKGQAEFGEFFYVEETKQTFLKEADYELYKALLDNSSADADDIAF